MAGSLNKAGKRYADRSKSSIISHLLNDDADNCRRQMEQRGIKPKNHHRDNLKNIAKLQAMAKQQEMDKIQRANRANKKNPKYKNIDSKLKQSLSSSTSSASKSSKKSTNFIAQNMSRIQSTSALNKKEKNSSKMTRKAAIPTRSELTALSRQCSLEMKEAPKDFVALNKRNGQEMHRKKQEKETVKFMEKKDYGKVPQYMIQMKMENEAKEREAMEEAERAKIPKGMRKMTEEERTETMQILECNKKQIMEQIKNLPLVIETPSMIRHQSQLNQQMNEIEKTMAVFRKPIVYVAMDE